MAKQAVAFSQVATGYTRFAEGDVLWAKITPCMQNGKSGIAKGLIKDVGFGSTEFHVLRPNKKEVSPEYLWSLLSLDRGYYSRTSRIHRHRWTAESSRYISKNIAISYTLIIQAKFDCKGVCHFYKYSPKEIVTSITLS